MTINKYNLALIPYTQSEEIVAFANKFRHLAENYLIGEQSLPHLTLYQFHAKENDIHSIWENVHQGWRFSPLRLVLNQLSYIAFDNQTDWVSLLPDNRGMLYEMHAHIAGAISLPVNPAYDPHVTLMNTRHSVYKKEVASLYRRYRPITDNFILAVGASDEIGQFKRLIYHHKIKSDSE